MRRLASAVAILATTFAGLGVISQAQPATAKAPDQSWIATSNQYTQMLLAVQLKHSPEGGSAQGLVQFDPLISDPTRADEILARKETEAILAKFQAAQKTEKNKDVQQDLAILIKAVQLQFRQEDYQLNNKVFFINASAAIFGGLQTLLDDQVPAERRPTAVVRLKKYTGDEPGFKPLSVQLEDRMKEQMVKPGAVYPSKGEMETELSRNQNYVDGIAALFTRYKLTGWEPSYAKLKVQLADYDAWIRSTILPKARTDFRLPAQEYALNLEAVGVDLAPAELSAMAHAAFTQYQTEMGPLAAQVAKAHGFSSTDYRDVIAQLKKTQITGDAILPFYKARLKAIEDIIVAKQLVTLPDRPAIIRLATAAETAQQPAPHMVAPAFLNNTGQKGEFVLPLNAPGASGKVDDKYDDFTFDAVAWTMTAHEARPGHELQFDSMLEHGVSLARALYAFNSTNVEGWGLYSEWVMQPYEPADGQLLTLQLRLLRAARAFLDPGLQAGTVTQEDAYRILEKDVMLSHAFAKEEVERFTYRMPGQANSYFYGYTKLLALRKDTEAALGPKFNQKKYHDFLLAQGLLPPDLMRKAVMTDFVPSQK